MTGAMRMQQDLRGSISSRGARCVAVLLFLPVIAFGQSAPTTGTLQVSAQILSGCRVVGQRMQTTGIDFGTVDFGSHPSIFVAPLTARSQGPLGTLQLTCIGIVSASVSISAGMHAQGNQRQLASGVNRVPYDLYADGSFNVPFTAAAERTLVVSPTGSVATVDLTIYAKVHSTPGGYATGSYQDNVQITVSW